MTVRIELEGVDATDLDQNDAERMSAAFRVVARDTLGHSVEAVDVHLPYAAVRDRTVDAPGD